MVKHVEEYAAFEILDVPNFRNVTLSLKPQFGHQKIKTHFLIGRCTVIKDMSKIVVFKLQSLSKSCAGLVKRQAGACPSTSSRMEAWFCISNRFSGDVNAEGLGTKLRTCGLKQLTYFVLELLQIHIYISSVCNLSKCLFTLQLNRKEDA